MSEIPELESFDDLPRAPQRRGIAPASVPALDRITQDFDASDPDKPAVELVRSIIDARNELRWLLTYSEDQVGADFLARYGWFELLGPTGHFHSENRVMFVGYWGANLRYPWHRHAAEEIYAVIDGRCVFERGGQNAIDAQSGVVSHHAPWQPHALFTRSDPVLTLVLQKGAGLNDAPEIMDDRNLGLEA